MSRIKINLPKKFVFKTMLNVHIGDINYGGHMGNDAYLRFAHEARLQFLKAQGWSEMDLDGLALIMTDAAIQFQAEVFHGEVLTIEIALAEVSKKGFEIYYKITSNDGQKQIASIKTGMYFFDYNKKRLAEAKVNTVQRLLAFCI